MSRLRVRIGILTGIATIAVSLHGQASELDAARNDAENTTRVLEQRPCPAFGDRRYLRGMNDSAQLVAASDRERSYQDRTFGQLQQIARDPKLTQPMRGNLQALASWSIAASMANWTLIQIAQQALANPLIAVGQPYPSAPLEAARERARQIAERAGLAPDAASTVSRQTAALDRCVKNFNAEAFKLNQPQFEAAVDAATQIGELNRLESQYRVREAIAGGYGAEGAEKLAARKATLAEAERVAREQAQAANAAENSRRQAEAQRRQAEMRAKLPEWLAVAQRFASAAQSGNERAALNELSQDVVMSTPQSTHRGIDAVTSEVRRQSASGGGSLGTPRIEGDRIVAYGNRGQFRLMTIFSFDAANRISRIDISI